MTSQVMNTPTQENLFPEMKVSPDQDLYVQEEELIHFKEYNWTMFNGEKFNKKVYDTHHEPIQDEFLDDIITYNSATVVWMDAYGMKYTSLHAPEITFRYVMNSILFQYKRMRRTPCKVCILEKVMYNPFTRTIRVVFGS